MECYLQLVDRFYAECKDKLAQHQYIAAKRDIEYFLQLVELAIGYKRSDALDKERSRLLS